MERCIRHLAVSCAEPMSVCCCAHRCQHTLNSNRPTPGTMGLQGLFLKKKNNYYCTLSIAEMAVMIFSLRAKTETKTAVSLLLAPLFFYFEPEGESRELSG